MNVAVLDKGGKDTGRKVALSKTIFGIEPNDHSIYLDVKHHMANRRQGTNATKERSDITGSTRKLRRQKGTGAARVGSIKNPLFRGGGTIFGPRPRDYSFKLNKKVRSLARKSALSYKAKEKNITVVEDFNFEAPKTKDYKSILSALKAQDMKTLLVLPESKPNVVLSGRNLQNTKVILAENLNTYDVLHADKLMFMESSIEKVEKLFS